jgi:ADP-ribose diphosphatase
MKSDMLKPPISPKPEVIETKIVAKSRYFSIEQVRLRFPGGEERYYERLREWDTRSVIMVALRDPDTLLLIREYACGIDQDTLTLPKGMVEAGESDVEAANRELKEEIGHGAGHIELLGELTLAPGHLCHKITVLLADQLYPQRLTGDEPQEPAVVPVALDEVEHLIQLGKINEARTIAAIYLAKAALRGRATEALTRQALDQGQLPPP